MPIGLTTTDALADSLPTIIASARIVREQKGGMPQLVDRVTLGVGVGLSWNEVSLAQLTAQEVTETTELDNPQQLSDTLFTITPTVKGIQTLFTDRVAARISSNAFARTGELAGNAIERKKNQDGLVTFSGAGTGLAGAGTTLTSGHIAAGSVQITSNVTEPGMLPVRFVGHGFQIKDFYDEITAAFGTSMVPEGMSASVFASGFRGAILSADVFENGDISIDGSDDAIGGVFARDAIVLVQGRAIRTEIRREPHIGGGATSIFIYDEYAYGERSAGNWLFSVTSDATAPTS